jgi:Flp pilus assembly protein TadG
MLAAGPCTGLPSKTRIVPLPSRWPGAHANLRTGATTKMPYRRISFQFCRAFGELLLIKRTSAGLFCRKQAPRDVSGAAAVEFALIVPVLLLIMLGTFVFGIAFVNYIMVTNAADAGTLQLTVSRGDSTPYTDTVNAIYASAPALTKAQLTISLTVNGTACSSDSTCQTALTPASAGQAASVKVSYPCSLIIMQTNYLPSCTLTANSTGRIQ